jgi:hypothetical protein
MTRLSPIVETAQVNATTTHRRRGNALLLAHCAAFGTKPSAYARLESEVGEHLARVLVSGLGAHSARRA